MTPDLVKDFFDYFGDEGGKTLCNFYGSTEMMDVTFAAFRSAEDANGLVLDGKVSREQLDQSGRKFCNPNGLFQTLKVPIGHPVANTAAYVLNEDMKPVKGGEVGELYIASNNLALGYAGDQGLGKFLDNKEIIIMMP